MDDLPAAGLAGRYGNGGTRNLQKICQEFDTGRVGAAFRRWRRERQFECVAEFASDSVRLSSRMKFDGEGDALRGRMNRDHDATTIYSGGQLRLKEGWDESGEVRRMRYRQGD